MGLGASITVGRTTIAYVNKKDNASSNRQSPGSVLIVRCWYADGWRFRVENPRTQVQRSFTSQDDVANYLRQQGALIHEK